MLSGEVEARGAEITAWVPPEIHAHGESVILFDWAQCDATDYTYVEAYEHSDVKVTRAESSCRAHDSAPMCMIHRRVSVRHVFIAYERVHHCS